MRRNGERGVTLLELLLVVALLTMVTAAVIAFIHSAYDSYAATSERSLDQQQAATLLNRLAQDIREAQSEADDEAIEIERVDASDLVSIKKSQTPEGDPYTAVYGRREDGAIVYRPDSNRPDAEIVLADRGRLTVTVQNGAYQLSVTVGEGADSITLHTSVARYDWGR